VNGLSSLHISANEERNSPPSVMKVFLQQSPDTVMVKVTPPIFPRPHQVDCAPKKEVLKNLCALVTGKVCVSDIAYL